MRLGRANIFLLLCLGLILGVFLGRYANPVIMAILAMVFVITVTVWWPDKKFLVVGFLSLAMLFGIVRYQTSTYDRMDNFIANFAGQEQELVGVVIREPDVRTDKMNLTLKVEGYTGYVLVTHAKYPVYYYGDKLRIQGKLEVPFENEEFSYRNYLSRYDTYAVMYYPHVEKLAENQGNPVISFLFGIKGKFLRVLSQILPEPHNALSAGIILGAKRAIPEDLKDILVAVGISHIIVVSGYNITMMTQGVLRAKRVMGSTLPLLLALFMIFALVIVTGAEASVLRAGIMGLGLVIALYIGRLYSAPRVLIITAAIMIAINPKILHFDIGFQLSFLATLGLVYVSPIFEKWFQRIPNFLSFRSNLATTFAAQLFALPLLVWYFDRISIISLLVNVLVLWIVPYAMSLTLLAGLLGIIFLPLGKILGVLLWLALEYLIRVSEFFARVPYAQVSARMSIWLLLVYYLLLIFFVAWYRQNKKFRYYLEYVKIQI